MFFSKISFGTLTTIYRAVPSLSVYLKDNDEERLIAKPGGKISQQELGLHFALKPGSLSEILSKCEAIGLIERSRSTEDRRQLIVELTEEGARQAELEQAARIKFRSEAFSALTLEEREQLLIMLNKIRNTWEGFDD